MNRREENLIRILYERKNTFVLVREMAEHENCSDKTIRNSLNKVEKYLSKFSSDLKLDRIKGKGICLRVKENSRWTLNHVLGSSCLNEETLSTRERRFELAYTLLMSTKAIILKEFSKKYYVNKKVIADDLVEIRRQLEKYNLKIISKQRVGNYIEGVEKDKREALAQTIKNQGEFNKAKDSLKSIFMPYEIEMVNKAIVDLQNHMEISFVDESSDALTIHILFMIKRIKLNQSIKLSRSKKDLVAPKIQYSWAMKLAGNLEEVFSIRFPEDEIIYLAIHLLGAKYNGDNTIELSNFIHSSEANIVDILMDRLLDNLEKIGETSFKSDGILIQALRLHLYASLNRINYGLSLENPILDKIKQMSPYLYYEVLDIIDRFNTQYNMNIPKEEVAYITIHFQASIERNRKDPPKKYSAIILCHLGIGISNYLKIKLEKIFPWIDFKGSISVKEIREYTKSNSVNFIFSTVDIDKYHINYIKINSIIDETEEKKIEEAINKHLMTMDLKKDRKVHKFIYNEFIFLNKNFQNKTEIIKFITDELQRTGRIDEKFFSTVLKREAVDSTEIGNFLAIPHGSTDHIISSTISILTLRKPIVWDRDQVQIIFLLAVKKDDYSKDNTMRNFFKFLNNLAANKEVLKKLMEENNINLFLKSIKNLYVL